MNAPKFEFDPDDRVNRLPVAADSDRRELVERDPYRDRALGRPGYGAPGPGDDDEAPQYRDLFFRYLRLAITHWRLILGICAVALIGGLVVTYASTPIYRATATIQIDREAARVVKVDSLRQESTGGNEVRFYQTQYDLLQSRSVAEHVAADLDLASATDLLNPKPSSVWGMLRNFIFPKKTEDHRDSAQRKAAAASIIQGGLSILPVLNSRLVKISFDSPSPEWAQKIADGVADTFISANLERRYGASAYARNFIKERLDELKIKLEESEKAVVAYAEQMQIINTVDGKSLVEGDLTAWNDALLKLRGERLRAQEIWLQANSSKGLGLPQVMSDASIQALRTRRAGLMADYQDKLKTFKPAYPEMLKLKAQIDQVDREISDSVGLIKDSLKAQYDAALQQETLLETNIAQAKAGVLDLRSRSIQYKILQRESDTNRTLYEGLLQQYKDIGVAGAVGTNNVAIVDHARRPGAPFKPSLSKNLTIAFIVGLILAFVALGVVEILDDTFKSPQDIEEQLGLAVLGIIPKSDGAVIDEIKGSPNSPIAEAYRSFRTALQFSTDQGAPKCILVTSARPGEGKSTTALALSMNLVQLGQKVLLIDADLRNPSQHRLLHRDNSAGLANYLAGISAATKVFQTTDIPGLYFMSTGPLPPNPAELLAGPKMASLLSVATENFDVVVVDGPPVMGLADAPLLSSVATGTLLVMATSDTRRGVIRAALKRLHFARARMLGAVLNKFDFHVASYGYGYGYGYGSGYGYGALEYYGYGEKKPAAQVES